MPGNKVSKTSETKGENRIDCIKIDNESNRARIYFHLVGNNSNVQFWYKASEGLKSLEPGDDFGESGYRKIEDISDAGINYYFVIDTKSTLSDYYDSQDIKGQIKTLLDNLGDYDSISIFIVNEEGASSLTQEPIHKGEDGQNNLSTVLDSIEYNSADTNIYNGLYDACCQIGMNRDINYRDVVVAISDGVSQKNRAETEIEDKNEDPLYFALREYGMSLYFIKFPETEGYVEGKSDYVSSEIDTETPISISENCVEELRTLLVSDCYVTEVEYVDPQAAWPLFSASFENEESTEDNKSKSVHKYRFFPEYLKFETPVPTAGDAEEETSGENTSEVSEISTNTDPLGDSGSKDDSSKSGFTDVFKNKWPIFVAVLLTLLFIAIVIIIIAKKKQHDKQIELYMNKEREKKSTNSSSNKSSSGSSVSGTSGGSKGAYYINKGATTGVPLTIEINSGGALLTKLQARINGSAMLGRSDICDIVINNQNLSR